MLVYLPLMFERYTERARRVLFFARYEASQIGSLRIEADHVLLGLVREGQGLAGRVLSDAKMSFEDIRRDIEEHLRLHERVPPSVEIPFTEETKRILHFAAEESDRLLHTDIGTEHLLLGILREDGCHAAQLLIRRGLRIEAARERIVAMRPDGRADEDERPGPPPARIRKTDVGQTTSLYEARVSRSSGEMGGFNGGPNHWSMCGAPLRTILARACDLPEVRIDVARELDDGRLYDCVVVLPDPVRHDELEQAARAAIERAFGAVLIRERRLMDAVVISVGADGPRLEPSAGGGGGGMGFGSFGGGSVDGHFSMHGSIGELCRTIEMLHHRVVVDETGLTDSYRIDVQARGADVDAFVDAVAGQLGLTATRAKRDVEMIALRPRPLSQPQNPRRSQSL